MNLLPCLPLDGGRIMESLITLYGKHGRSNQELVLKISAVVAGAVALRCAYCLNSDHASVVPLAAFSWLPDPHRIILRGPAAGSKVHDDLFWLALRSEHYRSESTQAVAVRQRWIHAE